MHWGAPLPRPVDLLSKTLLGADFDKDEKGTIVAIPNLCR